uniref:thiamine phosphate synthase n=1 Tax=Maribacter sp. TaxID=1897614 RepID=UPI0025C3B5FD
IIGRLGYQVILEELKTDTPIIAIGGITIDDVKGILETGISGIAISREITQDFNKIGELHKLLNAGNSLEQRYSFEK